MNTRRVFILTLSCVLGGSVSGAMAQSATQPATRPSAQAINDPEQAIANAQSQVRDAEQAVADMRNLLRSETDRLDVSAAALNKAAENLDDQMQSLTLDRLGAKSRMDALADDIAALRKQAQAAADADPAVIALNKEIDAQTALEKMYKDQYANGVGTGADIQKAEAALADAQAQAYMQRDRVIAANGGDTISALNKELVDLQVNISEFDTRAKRLKDIRDQLAQGLQHLDSLTDAEDALQTARKRIAAVQQRVEALRAETQARINDARRQAELLHRLRSQPNQPAQPPQTQP